MILTDKGRKSLKLVLSYLIKEDKEVKLDYLLLPKGILNSLTDELIHYELLKECRNLVIVNNWPTEEVETKKIISMRQYVEVLDILSKKGRIIKEFDFNQLFNYFSNKQDSCKIGFIDEPIKLRRSWILLKEKVKGKPVFAYTKHNVNVNVEVAFNDKRIPKEVVRSCVDELRKIQDNFYLDDQFDYKEIFSDEIINSYDFLVRSIQKKSEKVLEKFDKYRATTLKNYNYNNVGILPDGKGGYYVDNWGMAGVWECYFETKNQIPNRLIIRAIDAISKFFNEQEFTEKIKIRIIEKNNDVGKLASFDQLEKIFTITPKFLIKSRDEQIKYWKNSCRISFRDCFEAVNNSSLDKKNKTDSDKKTTVLVTQLAIVEEFRPKDYQHYKCGQKAEDISRQINDLGYESAYIPIENSFNFEIFIQHYTKHKQDIVLISMYQTNRQDFEIYHKLVSSLRNVNPGVFIVVEGAATNMAKQFICLSPEINMMIRVESNLVLPRLLKYFKKQSYLTIEEIGDICHESEGGVFIRSGPNLMISRLNKSNVSNKVSLLPPQRLMFDMWYSERGCPNECLFCRRDNGGAYEFRSVSVHDRINWMVNRLILEFNESISTTELKNILEKQSKSKLTIRESCAQKLKKDTFIGRDKIHILILSENALVNSELMLDFIKNIKKLGLQKYFTFKIADTDITTLMKNGKPYKKYIKGLHDIGVNFIGFGTENPSDILLKRWKKAFNGKDKGYSTDDILSVNAELLKSDYNPTSIRHNIMFSHPDSTMDEVKSAMLLIYLSPQYNSIYNYFGNGWGNNREERTFDVPGSFCSSIDHAQYCRTYDMKKIEKIGDIIISKYFYIADKTPEYKIRREFRFLKYIDERIPLFCIKYGHPTFYRYAQKNFLKENIGEEDVKKAVHYWRYKSNQKELNCLGLIFGQYRFLFPEIDLLDIIFLVKAHMVSLGKLSFIEFYKSLRDIRNLPVYLEECNVGKFLDQGDNLMVPGSFSPICSIRCFSKAAFMSRIIEKVRTPSKRDSLIINCLAENVFDKRRNKSDLLRIINQIKNVILKNAMKYELQSYNKHEKSLEKEGYLSRVSYPDQQKFGYLRHLYVTEKDKEIFFKVVDEMNVNKLDFSATIKKLICKRLSITLQEYPSFIRAVNEYKKNSLYYCKGGIFDRLKSDDKTQQYYAKNSLIKEIKNEDNPYILNNARLLLKDLP